MGIKLHRCNSHRIAAAGRGIHPHTAAQKPGAHTKRPRRDGEVVSEVLGVRRARLPPACRHQEADEGGLFVEVMPGGAKVWRLRYRVGGRGAKQEKITLGEYPVYSLAEARTWRDDCKALAGRGLSPMGLRRGDAIPEDRRQNEPGTEHCSDCEGALQHMNRRGFR